MVTYGDGIGDIKINELMSFHKKHGKAITMTAVQPEGRFGALETSGLNDKVSQFIEKPRGDSSWINGGFFVCEPKVFEYIDNSDQTSWERTSLEAMARDGELFAYKHYGFWKPMDTLRDKNQLEELWNKNEAP